MCLDIPFFYLDLERRFAAANPSNPFAKSIISIACNPNRVNDPQRITKPLHLAKEVSRTSKISSESNVSYTVNLIRQSYEFFEILVLSARVS
jgi:hypothetical protein